MDTATVLSTAGATGMILALGLATPRRRRASTVPEHRPRQLRRPRPVQPPPAPPVRPTGGDSRLPADGLWPDPDPST